MKARRKPKRRKSGVTIPKKAGFGGRLFARCAHAVLRLSALTFRYRWHDEARLLERLGDEVFIFCIWHNRLGVTPGLRWEFVSRHARFQCAALISASGDGGLLSEIMSRVGLKPVRGSSSRRGGQALLELTHLIEKGHCIGITPDGPRGPCYSISPGIISLAQLSGKPIIPVSCHIRWKYCLRTWDQFQIPLPFSRIDVHFGKEFRVTEELTEEDRDSLMADLKAQMARITRD